MIFWGTILTVVLIVNLIYGELWAKYSSSGLANKRLRLMIWMLVLSFIGASMTAWLEYDSYGSAINGVGAGDVLDLATTALLVSVMLIIVVLIVWAVAVTLRDGLSTIFSRR